MHDIAPPVQEKIIELETMLRLRERQIEAMRRTSEALFSYADVDAMVRETLSLALDVLGAESGTLYLHDPAADTLVFRYVIGPAADTLTGKVIPATAGIAGQVFQTGVADLTDKVSERAAFNRTVDEQSGYHTESMMTVPVKRSGGRPIGVMQVLNARAQPFDERDLEVLQVLCSQAAAAIDHARLLQEARRAEIVNVIGDISHDIKNMLTPIQSGVWTLTPMLEHLFVDIERVTRACPEAEPWGQELNRIAGDVRDHYRWMLDNMLEAADQVQTRTKEIADAVKGELAEPVFEEADINETAREVARTLRLVADKASIHLHLDLDPDLPRALVDRRQVYNALYNLVNNAIPETPAGGSVTLRTRAAASAPETPDDQLLVEVEDTGRGMPEAVRARLFTDQAVSTKPGGTGLGTRIVGGVVQRHRGTINVRSREGEGTAFAIRLPLRQ